MRLLWLIKYEGLHYSTENSKSSLPRDGLRSCFCEQTIGELKPRVTRGKGSISGNRQAPRKPLLEGGDGGGLWQRGEQATWHQGVSGNAHICPGHIWAGRCPGGHFLNPLLERACRTNNHSQFCPQTLFIYLAFDNSNPKNTKETYLPQKLVASFCNVPAQGLPFPFSPSFLGC